MNVLSRLPLLVLLTVSAAEVGCPARRGKAPPTSDFRGTGSVVAGLA